MSILLVRVILRDTMKIDSKKQEINFKEPEIMAIENLEKTAGKEVQQVTTEKQLADAKAAAEKI